jgi:hypothetical protein
VIGTALPAVVRVETNSGSGSGFYVKPDTILTNVHVVETNLLVTIRRQDGKTLSARVETRRRRWTSRCCGPPAPTRISRRCAWDRPRRRAPVRK